VSILASYGRHGRKCNFSRIDLAQKAQKGGVEGVKRSTMENPKGVVYIAPQNPISGLNPV
jgi:hypothetical protein